MKELGAELVTAGLIDDRGLELALHHPAAADGAIDVALLELDLVGETDLCAALARITGLPAATRADLEDVDPAIAARVPPTVADAYRLCPVRFEGDTLVALVARRLPADWVQELVDLFGVRLRPLVTSTHHLAVAHARLFGGALAEAAAELETRLAARRSAPSIESVASVIERAGSLEAAAAVVADHAARAVELVAWLAPEAGGLRPWIWRASVPVRLEAELIPLEDGCALAAPARLGGYFLGWLEDTPAQRRFHAAFGRPVPRFGLIAPIPGDEGPRLLLYADNGARAISSRTAAELMLLCARVGRWRTAVPLAVPPHEPAPPPAPEPKPAAAGPETPPPAVSPEDLALLERLHRAAAQAHISAAELVDRLLGASAPAAPPTSFELEMKELFRRLATDIPAQLANGIEAALRTSLAARPPAPPAVAPTPAPALPTAPPGDAPAAAARPAVVQVRAASTAPPAREVPDYRTRRRKAQRIDL